MKTKAFILVTITFALIMSACNSGKTSSEDTQEKKSTSIKAEDITIDTESSKILWKGEALGVYAHTGTVDFKEATITVSDGEITGGQFVADLTTITPTDENYNPEEGSTKEKLVGHLSSPDFFDIANYPEASFVITEVSEQTATGNLTIRGNTHVEKVKDITVAQDGDTYTIKGILTFDRKKYDVSWDYPMKDRVLSKDIVLDIQLKATS